MVANCSWDELLSLSDLEIMKWAAIRWTLHHPAVQLGLCCLRMIYNHGLKPNKMQTFSSASPSMVTEITACDDDWEPF